MKLFKINQERGRDVFCSLTLRVKRGRWCKKSASSAPNVSNVSLILTPIHMFIVLFDICCFPPCIVGLGTLTLDLIFNLTFGLYCSMHCDCFAGLIFLIELERRPKCKHYLMGHITTICIPVTCKQQQM